MLDRRDAWHERVVAAWERHADGIQVPATVIVETCQLLSDRVGTHAEEGFLRGVARGEFLTAELEPEDYARAAELVGAYADLPLGFVDASVVALAERLTSDTVLTVDRRHFGIVRPRHVERLRVVP